MADYFCRTIHGLEDLIWEDIQSQVQATLGKISHRTIEFTSKADCDALLSLRSIDDLFLTLTTLSGISHTREALSRFNAMGAQLAFPSIPPKNSPLTFSITASFLGKRNYNRWEIAEAIRSGISKNHNWVYLDPRNPITSPIDIAIRVHLEADNGIIGTRLSPNPLYKRSYKVSHAPGSLTAPVAYLMAQQALSQKRTMLLDPVCGVGTIPIEAALGGWKTSVGIDIDYASLQMAAENTSTVQRPHYQSTTAIQFTQATLNQLPLKDESVDAIVCDLPWNSQTSLISSSPTILQDTVREFLRVTRSAGQWVILVEDPKSLIERIPRTTVRVCDQRQVSLFGRHPTLLCMSIE